MDLNVFTLGENNNSVFYHVIGKSLVHLKSQQSHWEINILPIYKVCANE